MLTKMLCICCSLPWNGTLLPGTATLRSLRLLGSVPVVALGQKHSSGVAECLMMVMMMMMMMMMNINRRKVVSRPLQLAWPGTSTPANAMVVYQSRDQSLQFLHLNSRCVNHLERLVYSMHFGTIMVKKQVKSHFSHRACMRTHWKRDLHRHFQSGNRTARPRSQELVRRDSNDKLNEDSCSWVV